MPEVCEVCIISQFLNTTFKNSKINSINVLSGRYSKKGKELKNLGKFNKLAPFKILGVDAKGKFMWFELRHIESGNIYYITCTLGLTGEWTTEKDVFSHIEFSITRQKKNMNIYFSDMRNFGTINLLVTQKQIDNKLNQLGMDFLKEDYDENILYRQIEKLNTKTSNKKKKIVVVLMDQKKTTGIGSGLGNYLVPEILFRAKLSPHRTMESLDKLDIKRLTNSIKYMLRLCYLYNTTNYIKYLSEYILIHYKQIKNKEIPNYRNDIKIKEKRLDFKVYQQKKDPYGNDVVAEKILKMRTTYWSPTVQK